MRTAGYLLIAMAVLLAIALFRCLHTAWQARFEAQFKETPYWYD